MDDILAIRGEMRRCDVSPQTAPLEASHYDLQLLFSGFSWRIRSATADHFRIAHILP